jgi:predicted  nucleic acid-binding Zn-ribbon protein
MRADPAAASAKRLGKMEFATCTSQKFRFRIRVSTSFAHGKLAPDERNQAEDLTDSGRQDKEQSESQSPGADEQTTTDEQDQTEGTDDNDMTDNQGSESATDPATTIAPASCGDSLNLEDNDYVIYAGENLQRNGDNTINLSNGWRIDEAWDNGTVNVELFGGDWAMTFTNEGIYHGFKITPPTVNGQRRRFYLDGSEVLAYRVTDNGTTNRVSTYGLRIIKPGEFEGNGRDPKTSWMMTEPGDADRFFALLENCVQTTMHTPDRFMNDDQLGDRLIWEMQGNW